jgi:hypothetical protein
MKWIKYIGEDLIISSYNKTALYKDKVYLLQFDWDGQDMNGYWIFYIYDDLPGTDFRGYELPVKNVISLRDFNLDLLCN